MPCVGSNVDAPDPGGNQVGYYKANKGTKTCPWPSDSVGAFPEDMVADPLEHYKHCWSCLGVYISDGDLIKQILDSIDGTGKSGKSSNTSLYEKNTHKTISKSTTNTQADSCELCFCGESSYTYKKMRAHNCDEGYDDVYIYIRKPWGVSCGNDSSCKESVKYTPVGETDPVCYRDDSPGNWIEEPCLIYPIEDAGSHTFIDHDSSKLTWYDSCNKCQEISGADPRISVGGVEGSGWNLKKLEQGSGGMMKGKFTLKSDCPCFGNGVNIELSDASTTNPNGTVPSYNVEQKNMEISSDCDNDKDDAIRVWFANPSKTEPFGSSGGWEVNRDNPIKGNIVWQTQTDSAGFIKGLDTWKAPSGGGPCMVLTMHNIVSGTQPYRDLELTFEGPPAAFSYKMVITMVHPNGTQQECYQYGDVGKDTSGKSKSSSCTNAVTNFGCSSSFNAYATNSMPSGDIQFRMDAVNLCLGAISWYLDGAPRLTDSTGTAVDLPKGLVSLNHSTWDTGMNKRYNDVVSDVLFSIRLEGGMLDAGQYQLKQDMKSNLRHANPSGTVVHTATFEICTGFTVVGAAGAVPTDGDDATGKGKGK